MKPVQLNLEMWSDSAFHERLAVTVDGAPEPFTGWVFKAVAAASIRATQPLFEITVTVEESGLLLLHVEADLLRAAVFPEGDTSTQKTVLWVLAAQPAAEYQVRLVYGNITIHRGLPL